MISRRFSRFLYATLGIVSKDRPRSHHYRYEYFTVHYSQLRAILRSITPEVDRVSLNKQNKDCLKRIWCTHSSGTEPQSVFGHYWRLWTPIVRSSLGSVFLSWHSIILRSWSLITVFTEAADTGPFHEYAESIRHLCSLNLLSSHKDYYFRFYLFLFFRSILSFFISEYFVKSTN
jgi:hypothetical protein